MSTHLASLQKLIAAAVRQPSPVAPDAAVEGTADALIKKSPRGMLPAERLEVYREQFWLRHCTNLQDDYPTVIWAMGGSDAFRAVVVRYLEAHPPRTWNLRELGADLPEHLAGGGAWRDDEVVRDAARLDWAFMEAFDAPDAPPLDARVLASAPEDTWPAARVSFHPSLRALELSFPLHDVRDAVKRGDAPSRPARETSRVVVWRDPSCFLHSVVLANDAFDLLVALREGVPLGEACERVARGASAADSAALGERIGAWFQDWTQRAWLSRVRFGTDY